MNGYGELENLETGEKLDLKVESSKTEIVASNILNSFISENVTDTSSTQYKVDAVATASTTGTTSGNQTDNSLAMTVYATIYYTTYTKNSFSYVGIDKVSYRFVNSDSSVTVSNKQIFVGQVGVAYSNGAGITGQKTTRNALDSETILVSNWGWDPVLKDGLGYACGIKITATLQRGTSSNWSYNFNLPL